MSLLSPTQLAKLRSKLNKSTREFFENQNFIEVETPILNPIPGMEPHLTPFETNFIHHQTGKEKPLYLNTSPELQMKKLLGTPSPENPNEPAFENIFTITKVFRNGEVGGGRHQPEFTMIEWYRLHGTYKDLMTDCENLILHLIKSLSTTKNPQESVHVHTQSITHLSKSQAIASADNTFSRFPYRQHQIDLTPPWPRATINELFQQYCHLDLTSLDTYQKITGAAQKLGHSTAACHDWDEVFYKIFLNEIEPHLGFQKPIFVYDYPASQAALARKNPQDPTRAERTELYIAGLELANGFTELTDAQEQNTRLTEEQALRQKLQKTVFPIDQDFLAALTKISNFSPATTGIALGLDRLYMLLLNQPKIENVLFFPLTTN